MNTSAVRSRSPAEPIVSVVTIFKDAGPYIDEAIRSVYGQSYQSWELLLVDDGSTDESTAIARAYAASDPLRVRYLQHGGHANRGMSASRNLGWRSGRGRIVAFLDADDVWLEHKLADQVRLLDDRHEAGAVIGATTYWYEWNSQPPTSERDTMVPVGDGLEERLFRPPELSLLLYPLGRGAAPSMSSLAVRRTVLESVGGFEERFRGLYEDQVFLAKLWLDAPIWISKAVWDLYRQHDRSCCATTGTLGHLFRRTSFLLWISGYVRKRRPESQGVAKAIGTMRRRLLGEWLRGMAHVARRSTPRIHDLLRGSAGPPPEEDRKPTI